MEESERKKAIELLKEMRGENNMEGSTGDHQNTRLNWMYKGPSDLVDREAYLLGKAIDKTFEVLNTGGTSDVLGRTGEQSNVPRRLLEKTESTEQVDIAKKILEDPLYAIKQKEMEARKKLLNNPVKLKQIKQMLMERNKQSILHKQKKKKSKKHSEQDLNLLILKKLKKLTDKEKKRALDKIMHSESQVSLSESSSSDNKEIKKHKSKRKLPYSDSDESQSSSETTSSSEENEKMHESKNKKLKSKNKKSKKIKKNKDLTSDSDSSDSKTNKKSSTKRLVKKKHSRNLSVSSSSSAEIEKFKKLRNKSKGELKISELTHENKSIRQRKTKENSERQDKNRRKRENSSDKDSNSRKNYGLMMPDGSKPEMRKRTIPVRKYEKHVEAKARYTVPVKVKPLSEKEREEKLKEMMENAKLRKRDREKNLASHRKKQALEEEPKMYDDDFIRRQMSHLTSQGTLADRIKCNVNNIQRSKSSMDTNFMLK